MAQYSPLSGEGLFDVAAKLYGNDTALGVQDLLSSNPEISINSDLFGVALTYTDGLVRKRPVVEPILTVRQQAYRTYNLQSAYDLAVQLYGDISKIGNILTEISDINGEIPLGSEFSVPEQTDPQAVFFLDKVVSTDLVALSGGGVPEGIFDFSFDFSFE